MIRPGFLDAEALKDLTDIARDGLVEHRLARRANALLLLNDGWSCTKVAQALYLDDDTVRTWYRLYEEDGIEGLAGFGYAGKSCELTALQQEALKAWVIETLPRTTMAVGGWIERNFGVSYTRSAIIKLLHRSGLHYTKPVAIGRKLDVEKQKAFIKAYNDLLNSLLDDEAVMFADGVHPTHAARPAGFWGPAGVQFALPQTSCSKRINIHGAIDLETGTTCIQDVLTVDSDSFIALLKDIQQTYRKKRLIHLFVDQAAYHKSDKVRDWLSRPDCRIKLHYIPAYSPHLDPIERLWGVMHKNVTHNKTYATLRDFANSILTFLKQEVPQNWAKYRDTVTDNFRVIDPADFRVLKT